MTDATKTTLIRIAEMRKWCAAATTRPWAWMAIGGAIPYIYKTDQNDVMDAPCLKSEYEHLCETFGDFSQEVAEWAGDNEGPVRVCVLPNGHDGSHEFEPTTKLTLVWKAS